MAVAASDTDVVMVDNQGRAAVRLPMSWWGKPDETADDAAHRIADALGLAVAPGSPSPGGDELVDPEGPPAALPVVGTIAAALPLVSAALLGLTGEGWPWTLARSTAAVGLIAVIVVGTGIVIRQRALAYDDGARRSGLSATAAQARLWFPAWCGILLALFVLWAPLLDEPANVGITVFTVLGALGVVISLGAPPTAFAWKVGCLVPAVVVGAWGLSLIGGPPTGVAWAAVAVGAAGVVALGVGWWRLARGRLVGLGRAL